MGYSEDDLLLLMATSRVPLDKRGCLQPQLTQICDISRLRAIEAENAHPDKSSRGFHAGRVDPIGPRGLSATGLEPTGASR